MTPQDLKEWRKRLGFKSQEKAAEALGISARAFNNYETKGPVPKVVQMACAAVALGLTLALSAAKTGGDK